MPLKRLELGALSGNIDLSVYWGILSLYPFAGLSSIRIVSLAYFGSVVNSPSLVDTIKPLLDLRMLRHVRVYLSNHIFHFDDKQLLAVGNAWPAISSLRFLFTLSDTDDAPVPDIRTIAALVRSCPSLKVLGLPALEVSRAPDGLEIPESPSSPFRTLLVRTFFAPHNVRNREIFAALRNAFPRFKARRDDQ